MSTTHDLRGRLAFWTHVTRLTFDTWSRHVWAGSTYRDTSNNNRIGCRAAPTTSLLDGHTSCKCLLNGPGATSLHVSLPRTHTRARHVSSPLVCDETAQTGDFTASLLGKSLPLRRPLSVSQSSGLSRCRRWTPRAPAFAPREPAVEADNDLEVASASEWARPRSRCRCRPRSSPSRSASRCGCVFFSRSATNWVSTTCSRLRLSPSSGNTKPLPKGER